MTTRTRNLGRSARVWIGGRFSPPFFIDDTKAAKAPFRPELMIWLEQPSGLVVGMKLLAPDDDATAALSALLRASMKHPAAGPPRRPDRIRVSDGSSAAELRTSLGDAIPIEVGPTPELDLVFQQLVESMPGGDVVESYLEEGRVSPEAVRSMFKAAELLHRMAPWKHAADDQVLRLDIPALGVDGACVSIIGALGQVRGLLIFPTFEGYEAFMAASEAALDGRPPRDFGTSWLALGFDRMADLPGSMRQEVERHRWPVVGPGAVPRVTRHDADGTARPLVERDLQIATACATSLSVFVMKHERLFETGKGVPVCESYFDENDLEVRFTAPYEAFRLFDIAAESRPPASRPAGSATAKVGRNDPCGCGSGRKYKKCHGAGGASPRPSGGEAPGSEGDPHHDLDGKWVQRLGAFAERRFGEEWTALREHAFGDAEQALTLSWSWPVYGLPVRGATVLERYLEEHERELSPRDREWLVAQRAAWLSIWEVTAVEPGVSITLHDLLTGDRRHVREASGSQTLVVHDTMLARVVDVPGVSLLCGVHPRPLAPIQGAEVVRRCRTRLRVTRRPIPVERVREHSFASYLIRRWEEAVAQHDALAAIPPVLRNTDGDPLLLTTDHFVIEVGAQPEVEARLAALENVERAEPGAALTELVFLAPAPPGPDDAERTVIGSVQIHGGALRAETNSTARADALRARIEAACEHRLRHRARDHSDPLSERARDAARGRGAAPEAEQPPEIVAALREIERSHSAKWIDESLPALGGRTPRQAARTVSGRAALDVLLKHIENRERRRRPAGAGSDFTAIRKELRLDP